jgi:hypothetical protein
MHRHLSIFFATLFLLVTVVAQSAQSAAVCSQVFPTYLPIVASSQQGSTMDDFFIIYPQTTINQVTNPSIELATTGYTAVNSSIARSSTKSRRGSYSLKVTPTSNTSAGAYYGTVSVVAGSYTLSFDIWVANGVTMQTYIGTTGGAVLSTPTTFTGDGNWHRIEHTYTEASSTTRRLYFTKNGDASTADFYVDGVLFENLAYATTYCDGDQTGCKWNGAAHGSTSTRSASYRGGGKKVSFQTLGAYLISQDGTGMAPVSNQTQPYASIDGSFWKKQTVKERSFTIAFSVAGDGTAAWHTQRQQLIDYIKNDLVYPPQPFTIGYRGGGKDVFLNCHYEDGFGISGGQRDIEAIPIKCIAPNPYWTTDGDFSVPLTVQSSVSSANRLLQRDPSTHQWSIIGSAGPNNTVFAMAYDSVRNYLYISGNLTSVGGTTIATNGVARWDGSTWTAIVATSGATFDCGEWTLARMERSMRQSNQ